MGCSSEALLPRARRRGIEGEERGRAANFPFQRKISRMQVREREGREKAL